MWSTNFRNMIPKWSTPTQSHLEILEINDRSPKVQIVARKISKTFPFGRSMYLPKDKSRKTIRKLSKRHKWFDIWDTRNHHLISHLYYRPFGRVSAYSPRIRPSWGPDPPSRDTWGTHQPHAKYRTCAASPAVPNHLDDLEWVNPTRNTNMMSIWCHWQFLSVFNW